MVNLLVLVATVTIVTTTIVLTNGLEVKKTRTTWLGANNTNVTRERLTYKLGGDGGDVIEDYDINVISSPDEDKGTKWLNEAILDVAYYLRNHKFNDYDRRYYTSEPDDANYIHLYGRFPDPPLKQFHRDVYHNCKHGFMECVRYLYEVIQDTNLHRSFDSALLIMARNWTLPNNADEMKKADQECKRLRKLDWETAAPFRTVLERFQWRVTASYYMCNFTLNEIPALKHLNESCNNFANCAGNNYATTQGDVRANDVIPFGCATYSFCPDPCCPTLIPRSSANACESDKMNPCKESINPKCYFNRKHNTGFVSMTYNEFNVTCESKAGFVFQSKYGMAVDLNECDLNAIVCDKTKEQCVNIKGDYKCVCNTGYTLKNGRCERNKILEKATILFPDIYETPAVGRSQDLIASSPRKLFYKLISYFLSITAIMHYNVLCIVH